MGGAKVRSPGRRYRRARRLRESPRGVVAVIGTLLALLVFFALFGIFLTQYVPLWMTDNESALTAQAQTSFATFKSYVDSQYLIGGPSSYGTPFTLSSNAVPLIAQPTQATLFFFPNSCPSGFYSRGVAGAAPSNYGQPVVPTYCIFQNVTFSYGPGGSAFYSQHVAQGLLEMQLPNRYFSAQSFYFEDDAVIQSQGGLLQYMPEPSPFNVTTVSGNSSLTTSFLQVTGNSTSITGQGTQQVFSHLKFTQTVGSGGKYVANARQANTLNATFEIGTPNPCAWQKVLWAQMNVSGLTYRPVPGSNANSYNFIVPGTTNESIPVTNLVCGAEAGVTTVLSIDLYNIDWATVFYAGVQLTIGIGGT
jgi:hypothetical protein